MGKQYFGDVDPPVPVRVCSFCFSIHHQDAIGFDSHRLEKWFCTLTCYEVYRYFSGQAENVQPGLAAELVRLKKAHFPDELIEKRKRRLREQIDQKRIKPIVRGTNGIIIRSA
jgi:hypothetical protein